MSADRAALILLARTGSTRLPRKSLLSLHGRAVIEHQIERLRPARRADVFTLATTTLAEDDALATVAARAGIDCFRGAVDDVVQRLVDAATAVDAGFVACVGGDDVFCEPDFVDAVIEAHRRDAADFLTVGELPFGTTPFGVTVTGLREVLRLKAGGPTDGWERYFTESDRFRTAVLTVPDRALAHPELRLDLDYPEDFALIEAVYNRLYDGTRQPPLREVVELLTRREPALAALNRDAHERWKRVRASVPLTASRG